MIKILVDSASDCRNNASLYDGVIPITVTIDETSYLDGVNLDADTFYKLLTESNSFPQTAQPSPQQFADIFSQAKENGDEVIYFALSSALSGTCQSATIAKDLVNYEKIYIIDTKTATHGINLLAGYAATLTKQGKTAEEIVRICENLKGRVKILAAVDTLEFLHRGGRLSKTAATVGELTKIKPIITVTREGTVSVTGKALGKAAARQQVLKQLAALSPDEAFPIYSLYTYGEENCILFEKALTEKGYPLSGRLQVGASIGAHVGPGVYGVLFVSRV
ncbi:MAG: DegV family protein [Clostridia bacterium]|nr:DegV family protein [Clostridia bacterium]